MHTLAAHYMTATIEAKPWDFSHVLDLVNSLSTKTPTHTPNGGTNGYGTAGLYKSNEEEQDNKEVKSVDRKDFGSNAQALGDFSRLWQYLGSPPNSAAFEFDTPKRDNGGESSIFTSKKDYASDGATFVKTPSVRNKTVQWQEQGSGEEHTGTLSEGSVVPETPTLTKTQRKKKNRKERRAKEAAEVEERLAKKAAATASESEADDIFRSTPATKASSHVIAAPATKQYKLRQRDGSGKAITSIVVDPLIEAAKVAVQKVDAATKASTSPPARPKNAQSPSNARNNVSNSKQQTQQQAVTSQNDHAAKQNGNQSQQLKPFERQVATPGTSGSLLTPASVKPSKNGTIRYVNLQRPTTPKPVPSKPPNVIAPMIIRTGVDRNWALFMKLIGDFYDDREHLINPMNLTTHNSDSNGIHVFVDASNIFIGFNDQLKRSRGIPPWVQTPTVNLSFDGLALLMERRRPVAKRVLAGSTPHLPAFDKAKAVGYECSILEKVYKARELTERQVFFKDLDAHRKGRAKAPPANNVTSAQRRPSGSGSGSETNAPQYAPAKMIEQGVDEILHLKILESVVDSETPSTIVLATGDAAQAEYSQGFMAMAERALKKGWKVELVSWSHNISAMYTRRAWKETWGDLFRIVFLDDYAEELLDM